jgi:hypothetical protein
VLGLGIWVASWMVEAARGHSKVIEVLGVETRAMAACRTSNAEQNGSKTGGDGRNGEVVTNGKSRRKGVKDS